MSNTNTAPALPSVTPSPAPTPSAPVSNADRLEALVGDCVTVSAGPLMLHGLLVRYESEKLVGWFKVKLATKAPHWADCAFSPDRVRNVSLEDGRALIMFD